MGLVNPRLQNFVRKMGKTVPEPVYRWELGAVGGSILPRSCASTEKGESGETVDTTPPVWGGAFAPSGRLAHDALVMNVRF